MTQAQVPSTYDRPDWERCDQEILCPLCDYELRGLTVSRCPECGYEFEWRNLLDPARRLHPYLFEHHPRRKMWALFRTLWGGLRPRQFWAALLPSQPSRLRRLIAYWLLVTLLGCIGAVGWNAVQAILYRTLGSSPLRLPGTQIDTLGSGSFGSRVWVDTWGRGARVGIEYFSAEWSSTGYMAWWFGLLVLWPWLTFLVLMIFQSSMRQARVRADHVLRCVLYCGDVGFWAGAAVVFSIGISLIAWVLAPGRVWPLYLAIGAGAPGLISYLVLVFGLLATATYRLRVAYQSYLHFRHATATVLLSQCVVLLVYTILYLLYALRYLGAL